MTSVNRNAPVKQLSKTACSGYTTV